MRHTQKLRQKADAFIRLHSRNELLSFKSDSIDDWIIANDIFIDRLNAEYDCKVECIEIEPNRDLYLRRRNALGFQCRYYLERKVNNLPLTTEDWCMWNDLEMQRARLAHLIWRI